METRKCKVCGRELPITEFTKTQIGTLQTCKECMKKVQRKGHEDKKAKEAEQNNIDAARKARLSDFTPRELLAELKSRGYKWQRMEVTIVQEIDYNKI